jgi:hypothetical protein
MHAEDLAAAFGCSTAFPLGILLALVSDFVSDAP